MAVCIVVCMIVGYLFGCIQTGYIVGRVNKIDIRAVSYTHLTLPTICSV